MVEPGLAAAQSYWAARLIRKDAGCILIFYSKEVKHMAIIGIDLGTTNSLAAVWRDGRCELIPNALGEYLTPSVVGLGSGEELLVGEVARQRLTTDPERTVANFKQFMGTDKTWELGRKALRAEELSALVLRRLREDAEAYLGQPVTEAVVSVPAYFNDHQRSATKLAGQLAGLQVERLINEPSAAALAHRAQGLADGTYVVVDFGGGTLDVSVVEMFENIVDIIAVSGDNHLGGNDIDQAILDGFLERNPALAGSAPTELATLRKLAELCKIGLTDQPRALMLYQRDGQDYSMWLDNSLLKDLCAPLLGQVYKAVAAALRDTGLHISQVDDVILVGGSCRMPLVRQYVRHLVGTPPQAGLDPEKTVAFGAGVVSGIKARAGRVRDMVLTDICPFTLGIRTRQSADGQESFSPIIQRNAALPVSCVGEYQTVHDDQQSVRVEIYQGEAMRVEENLRLGEIEMEVPPLPAGEAVVRVRFTYDINGILEAEVHCPQSGQQVRRLFVSDKNMPQEEVARRLTALQELKLSPREQEVNRLLITRGERLFTEQTGRVREQVARVVRHFITATEHGASPAQLARMRHNIGAFFDSLEGYSGGLAPEDAYDDVDWDDLEDEALTDDANDDANWDDEADDELDDDMDEDMDTEDAGYPGEESW